MQPGGFVLDQFLSPVAYRRPATARLLGRVDQTFTVCRPGTGGIKDLTRLHPSDFSIIQQVAHKVLTLEKRRSENVWGKKQEINLICVVHLCVRVSEEDLQPHIIIVALLLYTAVMCVVTR